MMTFKDKIIGFIGIKRNFEVISNKYKDNEPDADWELGTIGKYLKTIKCIDGDKIYKLQFADGYIGHFVDYRLKETDEDITISKKMKKYDTEYEPITESEIKEFFNELSREDMNVMYELSKKI